MFAFALLLIPLFGNHECAYSLKGRGDCIEMNAHILCKGIIIAFEESRCPMEKELIVATGRGIVDITRCAFDRVRFLSSCPLMMKTSQNVNVTPEICSSAIVSIRVTSISIYCALFTY